MQISKIFGDDKTFTDCTPKRPADEILAQYQALKDVPGFELKAFILEHFLLPDQNHTKYTADTSITITSHIENLWAVLSRRVTSQVPNSSLINLPYEYVVPGGRFREVFYWDSYFIMIGLQESEKYDTLKSMVDNFSFLIHSFGFIPNGNRTYFLSRSQPPFYALMVELLAEKDPTLLSEYLPYLEKEYLFWMQDSDQLSSATTKIRRVVRMPDGELLNRYWDDRDTPRPEGYSKELLIGKNMDKVVAAKMYREIRAACESGWDFSSRWLRDGVTFQSSYTTEIVPVDLNCLLFHLESSIGKGYSLKGDQEKSAHYHNLATNRKQAILKYCWSETHGFFMDYDHTQQQSTPAYTMAGSFPLFFNICTPKQAKATAEKLKKDFLKPGGFVTTLQSSSFQWDSPNGWAPMQWIAVKGLLNYGEDALARDAADRWMQLNDKIYRSTGKLIEKYNVIDMNMLTGGGEYSLQDGFGWTNGVYLKLKSIL